MEFAIRLLILMMFFMERISNCKRNDYIPCPLARSKEDCYSLGGIGLDINGSVSMHEIERVGRDFGGIYRHLPGSVVYPGSVQDIVKVVRKAVLSDHLTVAARGNGHSINGQAQALHGIVLDMAGMKGIEIFQEDKKIPYVEVMGGELWIDVLRACLRVGFAPRSWTDYLFLSVGGTLSNGGISGQTFRFGPQITNVLQLEVVTG